MTSARIALHLLLVCVVAGVGQAQDSHSQNSASTPAASTSTPAKKAAPAANHVVLKVGGVQVTRAEFESMIGDIEPKSDADKPEADEKDRRRLGDDYASVLMLSQQAVADHLDASPEIRRQLAVDRLQILSDAQFASLMRQSKPSAEEVREYYSSHLAEFDRVQVRRLFIWKTGAGAANMHGLAPEAARARADAILQASASGGDPEKLAESFQGSDEGLLDAEPIPFTRGALPANLEKVAFALQKGQWAEGEDTPDKLILLHLVERDRRPLAEVSSIIEQRVQGQKMQGKLDELKKKAGIWMDEDYFGKAVAGSREQRPDSNPPSKLQKSAEKTGDNQ
ncbi:MAG: peptidyl-prolyl cis-trans isomerase [Acidobacteriia bacterium]|nr:peptidyl-prolyl cis-trans isomerase [Terriglobia bacterium]